MYSIVGSRLVFVHAVSCQQVLWIEQIQPYVFEFCDVVLSVNLI